MQEGSLVLAAVTALVLVGGLVVERLLLHYRPRFYFTLGFPLGLELVPIPKVPPEEGRTSTVRWERDDELVKFWAEAGSRGAPMGLHGSVELVRGRGMIHLDFRWAPPWTPILATLWLASVGFARGEASFALPIGGALLALILYLYHQAVIRSAAELRWSFLSGIEEEEDQAAP